MSKLHGTEMTIANNVFKTDLTELYQRLIGAGGKDIHLSYWEKVEDCQVDGLNQTELPHMNTTVIGLGSKLSTINVPMTLTANRYYLGASRSRLWNGWPATESSSH